LHTNIYTSLLVNYGSTRRSIGLRHLDSDKLERFQNCRWT